MNSDNTHKEENTSENMTSINLRSSTFIRRN